MPSLSFIRRAAAVLIVASWFTSSALATLLDDRIREAIDGIIPVNDEPISINSTTLGDATSTITDEETHRTDAIDPDIIRLGRAMENEMSASHTDSLQLQLLLSSLADVDLLRIHSSYHPPSPATDLHRRVRDRAALQLVCRSRSSLPPSSIDLRSLHDLAYDLCFVGRRDDVPQAPTNGTCTPAVFHNLLSARPTPVMASKLLPVWIGIINDRVNVRPPKQSIKLLSSYFRDLVSILPRVGADDLDRILELFVILMDLAKWSNDAYPTTASPIKADGRSSKIMVNLVPGFVAYEMGQYPQGYRSLRNLCRALRVTVSALLYHLPRGGSSSDGARLPLHLFGDLLDALSVVRDSPLNLVVDSCFVDDNAIVARNAVRDEVDYIVALFHHFLSPSELRTRLQAGSNRDRRFLLMLAASSSRYSCVVRSPPHSILPRMLRRRDKDAGGLYSIVPHEEYGSHDACHQPCDRLLCPESKKRRVQAVSLLDKTEGDVVWETNEWPALAPCDPHRDPWCVRCD